ncbi:MAG: EAL domain-containing protein [Gammaproteobacteria bacterium]
MKTLPSLRNRYIGLATILAIGVVFISAYAYLNVLQVQESVREGLKDIRFKRDKLESVRTSYFQLYQNIDLFLLDPLGESGNIGKSINSASDNISDLKSSLQPSDIDLAKQVSQLSDQIMNLKSEVESLMTARMDVKIQYPGVAISAFDMSQPQQVINNDFKLLIDEIENDGFELTSRELYSTLMKAQTLWVRLVSQMRIYLANRLASFSSDILIQQAESLDSYYKELLNKLNSLELFYEEVDSFEGPETLSRIKSNVNKWKALFSDVRRLSENESWRADNHIMQSIIIPLGSLITETTHSIESFLSAKEKQLLIKHENNSNTLSQLLMAIIIAFIVFIVGLIVSIDWLIFRPLLNMSRVFKARALNITNEVIPPPKTYELGRLIESFQHMDEQIRLRHTELQKQAKKLADSEQRWSFALEGAGDGVWDWNPQTDEAFFSKRWNEIIGYSENEFPPTGKAVYSKIHIEDKGRVHNAMQKCIDGSSDFSIEFRLLTKNEKWKWILARGKVVSRDAEGRAIRMIGTHTDITDRKQIEKQLQIAATTFESNEGIAITDPDGTILRVNTAFTKTTGYSAEEAVGQNINILKSDTHDKSFFKAMWESIHRKGSWQGEVWDKRKNGEIFPIWLTITAVLDDFGKVTHYVGTHYDISQQKQSEKQIKKLAFFDSLTELPNRTLLQDRMDQSMAKSGRDKLYGALLLIDLDNFKMLNDTLGHHIGDKYLQQVAHRLKDNVREVDTVARLGGDEFVIILSELSNDISSAANAAEHVAETILSSLNQSYILEDITHHSSASIGISLFKGNEVTRDEIMKQADMAMYKAKTSGRNMIRFFDPEMESSVLERAELEKDLHLAINEKQFTLYYQSQVNKQANIIGAEVLVRWRHPQRGLVSPAEFIPVAEETGLIVTLGNWVLETACQQLAKWSSDPKMANLSISVNVSAKQFNQENFIDQVTKIIKYTGADPRRLKFELTETLLIENIEAVIEKMTNLQNLGICFSLDDFGTGYSSLSYLRRLPLGQLKIDKSFVSNITNDSNDSAIAKTIIEMGKSLGVNVIAEGVENESQKNLLAKLGCDSYQGFFFCKPMPIDDFEAFILDEPLRSIN